MFRRDAFLILAKSLMKEHKLKGWKVKYFDDDGWLNGEGVIKRTIGECNPHWKKLLFNKQYLALCSERQQKEIVLHEIAHALVPLVGHNERWLYVVQSIGGVPLEHLDLEAVGYPIILYSLKN